MSDSIRGMSRRKSAGVTLLELMIVIVIVAVLASIAIPSYRNYVIRAQRTDATSGLLRLATQQEKFYLQNNRYAANAELAIAPPNGLGVAGTENGWYALSIDAPSAACPLVSCFVARAAPAAGSPQAVDADCQGFAVNERGVRTATNSGGVDNTATCWR